MIRIENKKTYKGDGFYIGRPSPLGNPFPVDVRTSRAAAISMYRDWFGLRLRTINPTSKAFNILVNHYREYNELVLICWCAPLQCHGEVIRDFVLEVVGEQGEKEKDLVGASGITDGKAQVLA